jgi:BCD family chlorophyll transporter-like MFS transporter
MVVLALGGVGAAAATAWMHTDRTAGTVLAVLAFTAVGLGVSASGTSLLVLLAKQVDEPRRAAAAATVWVMMIVGFAVTAGIAGRALDPYGPLRLVQVSAVGSGATAQPRALCGPPGAPGFPARARRGLARG